MARNEKLFVGPHAVWEVGNGPFGDDGPRWEDLLDGGELDWNIGCAGWYAGKACCMPLKPRAACPRWPMVLQWKWGELCPGGMDCVTDWTTLDRDAEIAWFAAAFAEELTEVAGLVGRPPALRWGMVNWVLS